MKKIFPNKNNEIQLKTMGYNVDWIVPCLRKPSTKLWNMATSFTIAAVGIFAKIVIVWLNKSRVHNHHIFETAIAKRPRGIPLITVSNHHSCFDDPGLWGVLVKIKHMLNRDTARWSLTAHDICFTNKWHSYFFMSGKCIPVVRGNGIYQQAVDFSIEKLREGQWLHVFPEGKVNVTKDYLRFKWGIGRMLYELDVTPIIVPIWHIGMDEVLPNEPLYYLRVGKKLTFNIGQPLNISDVVQQLRDRNASDLEARKVITDYIENELMKLKVETERLHAEFQATAVRE